MSGKLKISVKQPVSKEVLTLRNTLLELVRLTFRLDLSDSLIAFQKTSNGRTYPIIGDFPFSPIESKQATKMEEDLLMLHIRSLPKDILEMLVYRRVKYCDVTYASDDKMFIENGLYDNNFEFKASIQLINTWGVDILNEKIKLQTEILTSDIKKEMAKNPWCLEAPELQPYINK